jgi:hypothetical protein
MLEQQGQITSVAASGLSSAVANLSTALASAPPPTTVTPGGQQPASPQPPGHNKQPPGKAKHDKLKGH